jgi:hypothetical protein
MALAGCGAEFAAVEEEIVDGGNEAGESEGGAFQSASSSSATRVTIGRTIVSSPPRKERVVVPTTARVETAARTAAPEVSAAQIADVLEATPPPKGAMEVAAAWTQETQVYQLVTHGDLVTWSVGYRITVASRRDGSVVRTRDLEGCNLPAARVRNSLVAICGADNAVAAVNPETLEIRWRRPLERAVQSVDAGGELVLVSLRNDKPGKWQEVVALSDEGEVRWRSWLPSSNVDLRGKGDQLFAFERDPTVWALDAADGHVRWSRSTEKAIYDVIPLHDSLTVVIGQQGQWVLDDGRDAAARGVDGESHSISEIQWPRLYSCDDGQLRAIDLEKGSELFHANVSGPRDDCHVLTGDDATLFVEGLDHLLALDTTQPAGPAPRVRIVGRYTDVINEHKRVRGLDVTVGDHKVRTDAHGRFAATVRMHGPISVRMNDISGDENSALIWPDGKTRFDVKLSNNYYEDCH